MKKILIVCLLSLACEGPSKETVTPPPHNFVVMGLTNIQTESCQDLVTVYDSNRKVTCYVLGGCSGISGISCLRDKDEVASPK